MAAYMSHAIMGEQLHNESSKEGNIFQVPISVSELRGYSLGADLAALSKNVVKDPHNFYTRDFFLTMIKYVKDNKLIENSSVMALLYGHMAHYFLDINTHPLVYYIECGCEKVGLLPNHHLVEGYLSAYLSRKVLGKDIVELKQDYFNQINLSDVEVSNLLNSVYSKVYNDYEVVKAYKKLMTIFSILEGIVKSGVISQEMLIRISQFDTFLEKNDLTVGEITNDSRSTFTNPVTGERHNESFMDLYNKSIVMTLDAMKDVNNCLYSGNSVSSLEKVFTDLSYDTGVYCSLGKNLVHVRKR